MGTYTKKAGDLVQAGRRPVPCEGKRPIMDNWQDLNIPQEERLRHFSNGHNYNLGVCCDKTLAAIDVDIDDPDIAQIIFKAIVEIIGPGFAYRIGQNPRFLVPVQIPGLEAKETSPAYYKGDKKLKIEALSVGQQFIAYGVHPDTSTDYSWYGGPMDWANPPVVELLDLYGLLDLLASICEEDGYKTRIPETPKSPGDPVGDFQITGIKFDDLAAAVMSLPSYYYDGDRDPWIKVVMGIHFETGGSDKGLDLAARFSYRGKYQDPSARDQPLEKEWRSMKPQAPGKDMITGKTIMKWARGEHDQEIRMPDPFLQVPETVDHRQVSTLADLSVTHDYVKEIEEANFIYPDLVIEGNILTVIASSSSGKTSIFFDVVSPYLAGKGHDVYYIDSDSPAGDHKRMFFAARAGGFHFLNPIAAHKPPAAVTDILIDKIRRRVPMKKRVYIFDTLKKYTDVMSKGSVRDFFTLMRAITSAGGTVILLGHSNKNIDKGDDYAKFEGVGDIRNDSDDLILLDRFEMPGHPGKVFATTVIDIDRGAKIRGLRDPITFEMNKERMTRQVPHMKPPNKKKDRKLGRPVKYSPELTSLALVDFFNKTDGRGISRSDVLDVIRSMTGMGKSTAKEHLSKISAEDGSVMANRHDVKVVYRHSGRAKIYTLKKVPKQARIFDLK